MQKTGGCRAPRKTRATAVAPAATSGNVNPASTAASAEIRSVNSTISSVRIVSSSPETSIAPYQNASAQRPQATH